MLWGEASAFGALPAPFLDETVTRGGFDRNAMELGRDRYLLGKGMSSALAARSEALDSPGFEARLKAAARLVESWLDRLLPPAEVETRLNEAMRYAVLGPGKRIRPFLVAESASLFGAAADSAWRVGAALECIHAYSLVHDDLPCMDDDDLRRGRPTAHRAFDEATAVLAGDGLLTLAFGILSDPAVDPDPAIRCRLVGMMAGAAGFAGMVGGQALDLAAEGRALTRLEIEQLQQMKTGALLSFACEAGAVLGRANDAQSQSLSLYARDLGLAFQVADDILDATGTAAEVGKTTQKDADAGKATFVGILGLERAKAEADRLASSAVARLERFDSSADGLRQAAHFVVARRA